MSKSAERHLTHDSLPLFLRDVGIRIPVSKDMFQVLDTNDDGVLSWEEVQKLLEWPTPMKRWAASLPLAELLADAILVENHEDPVEEISNLDDAQVSTICECLLQGLHRILKENVALLRKGLSAQSAKAQSQMEGEGAGVKFQVVKQMSAGSVDDFHGGLEGRIGGFAVTCLALLPALGLIALR